MVASNRSSRRRQAFSLVEMLVVIGIIAVLISLLLPAIGRARKQANTANCASNLHQIQLAMAQVKVDQPYGELPFSGWKGALSKYIGASTSAGKANPIFSCPQDDFVSPVPPGTPDFADIVVRVKRGTESWDIPLSPGPRCVKVSETGNTIVLGFEEQKATENNEHVDFDDLILELTTNADRTTSIKINLVKFSQDLMFLWDTGNDKQIMQLVTGSGAGTNIPNDSYSSYGVNRYINDIQGSADKIVALDYVASTIVPDNIRDNWNEVRFHDAKNELVFARHSKQVNALYGDGSVRLTRLALRNEYDMFGPRAQDAALYWKP